MKKSTAELLEELRSCENFRSFYRENEGELLPAATLAEHLEELLRAHGIKKADAIRRSELNEIYAYQIFSGVRVPERKKLLALGFGMELTMEEFQTLLKHAGYAQLYVKKPFDCILLYGICRGLTVAQVNELLFDYELETLG